MDSKLADCLRSRRFHLIRTPLASFAAILFGLGLMSSAARADGVLDVINHDPSYSVFASLLQKTGLDADLKGSGGFTVFAPTNAAFARLPAGTVDSLLKPQMKEKLTAVLTYHVVPGRLSVKDLWEASNKGGGKAKFKTVEGEELTVEFKGQALTIRDAKGNASRVTIQNVFQSNGVIHVIDSVLMPS